MILGPGTIGSLVALFLRTAGADVHVVGRSAESLEFVRGLGFENVWTERTLPDVAFDAVVETSNAAHLPAKALDLVEPGGRLVYIGLAGSTSLIDTRTLVLKDVTAVGILSASPGLEATIREYASRAVDPRPLVAATVTLDRVGPVLAGERPRSAGPGPKIHVDPRLGEGRRMNDFSGLVAVVTGGGSGIGAAAAALLRHRGARVAVLDRSTEDVPDGVLAVPCDVTDRRAVDRAAETVVERLDGLDVLINNAGIGAIGDIGANDDDEWARVLDVNVTGIARVTRAALPHLRRSSHAAVVNTCSAVAFVGVRQRALYSASKGAIAALTLAMAADHVTEGIRVNAVAPGTADTPWIGRLLSAADDPDAAAEALRQRQPMGRLVTADEVAYAIASLASPAAESTTGTILRVDGGMTSLRL